MRSILIVDDQRGIRLLLEELFKKEGYVTRVASSGLQAIEEVETEEPDCMLLDCKMPGMNGVEVLKKIKSNWPAIPIIMMTAYGETDLAEQVLNLGAARCFTKPFDIFEVRDAVNDLFESL